MSKPLLDIRHLHTWLRPGKNDIVRAVDDISFSIEPAETFCLVGESGSGKSISALSIMRLLPRGLAEHPHGEIIFNGENLLSLPEEQLQQVRGSQIAMIFQEPMSSLNPVFTIGEQIMETVILHQPDLSTADAHDTTLQALEQVKLPQARQRMQNYPHQLSGGQRQRVMIAMALACKPALLIADEPTTALDVTVQAGILQLLRELQDETGMSTLFITHDFGVVAEVAQKVGVMQQGKLVESGPTRQVLIRPKHDYTRQLLAAVPENLTKNPRPRFFASHLTSADAENNAPSSSIKTDSGAQDISSTPLIQVNQLKVWFPIRKGLLRRTVDHVKAIDDVDLEIKRGQIVALVGESGSGKTTLGRAILQLEPVTAGQVLMHDMELTGLSANELRPWRSRMQIAFQDPQSSLNPRLLVESALTEAMKVHHIGDNDEDRTERAAQVLERVQLEREHLWRYPHEFSGGQRQRIGLARALVLNPEFIVCDEITSALDVSVQAEILQLLLELRAERDLTLLFITHNIGVVEYLSDQTMVMYKGKIVEHGDTKQVCKNPQHEYSKELLSAVPRLSSILD